MSMTPGTTFSIYGIAVNPAGRLGEVRDDRVKIEGPNGSKSLGRTWTGREWPNTPSGRREAQNETGRLNDCTEGK